MTNVPVVVLVTGSNRGIGLEHVRQALAAGEHVIAACRDPANAADLKVLESHYPGQLEIEPLDVASAESIASMAVRLEGKPIDILINNAGLAGRGSWSPDDKDQLLETIDYSLWEEILKVNLFGPAQVTAAILPNLRLGGRKLIVMITSDLASIAGNTMGGSHAYRTSKAALNMFARGVAHELLAEGFTVIPLSPGWTKTDMGGEHAIYTACQSVEGQRMVMNSVSSGDSGKFLNLEGREIAW